MFIWTKRLAPEAVSDWTARLSALAGGERLAAIELPGAQRVRLEYYCRDAAQAGALRAGFGGQVRELRDADWQPAPATAPGRPLSFAGGRLLVTGQPEELASLRAAARPGQAALCIPAAMAFGAGEHATTAMCLRLLAEEAARRRGIGAACDLLDLGAGSGILALAACALGARAALGLDNDPHAVRTAKENAARNALPAARFRRVDLLRSDWESARVWPVIAANLFSELHIALLPRMAAALEPGGRLIASGVLRSQSEEVKSALRAARLALLARRRRGRWVAFLAAASCREV